ncbi:MAG: pyridoxamine 5'-phosphate oxidase [Desulfocapsaceae bacterium]|jgi:pyridoxamine 5'-phosphate oxidase|nr:pyridoxamine 5'-phosphate oxidase [Desulfocapsaceae bacterium]
MDISHFRRDYIQGGLSRSALSEDPVEQFAIWFEQAQKTNIADPTAMVLATVGKDGQPSQRSVLLKYFDQSGFVFFTNYGSRKAREIKENCKVSLLFVWLDLERQIIIKGQASKISAAESAKYFLSRPRDSQVAAWVSSQSNPLSSRQALMQAFGEMKRKFRDGQIPIPAFWGGFRVVPSEIEFWQGRASRLHDRMLYRRNDDQGWHLERLMP